MFEMKHSIIMKMEVTNGKIHQKEFCLGRTIKLHANGSKIKSILNGVFFLQNDGPTIKLDQA